MDRTDALSILAYAFADLVILSLSLTLGANALNSVGIPFVIANAAVVFPFVYPAYWALTIRRAIAVHLYNRQALGIGLVCIAFLLGLYDSSGIAYEFFFLLLFYWIDASFKAARRSDPLLRDTLHWAKLRVALWIVNLITILSIVIYSLALARCLPFVCTAFPGGEITASVLTIPFVVIPASGVALSVVVARRSADRALRRQIAWFGLFVFVQFATVLVAQLNSLSGVTYFLGFVLSGLFLYKSARSLVPLNKLSLSVQA